MKCGKTPYKDDIVTDVLKNAGEEFQKVPMEK